MDPLPVTGGGVSSLKPPDNHILVQNPEKTFSDLFQKSSPNSVDLAKASIDVKSPAKFHGRPAVFFSNSDISKLAAPLRFTLIGKFSHGRPPIADIRASIDGIGLIGLHTTGIIDHKHISIIFSNEEDFHKFWCKKQWKIKQYPMRVFKWDPNFTIDSESPLVPIWITLPMLPLHLYNKAALFSIASNLGTPLKLDQATIRLIRPSTARLCVAMDVSGILPDSIWIGAEEQHDKGFWQDIRYEFVPFYCQTCCKLGHKFSECFFSKQHMNHPNPKQSDINEKSTLDGKRSIPAVVDKVSGMKRSKISEQIYVPKQSVSKVFIQEHGLNIATGSDKFIGQDSIMDTMRSDDLVDDLQVNNGQVSCDVNIGASNGTNFQGFNDLGTVSSGAQMVNSGQVNNLFQQISAVNAVQMQQNLDIPSVASADSFQLVQEAAMDVTEVEYTTLNSPVISAVHISASLEHDCQSLEDDDEQQFMAGEWDNFISGEKVSDIFTAIPSLVDDRRLQSRNYFTAMELHARSCKVNSVLSLDELKMSLRRDSASIASAIMSKFPNADEDFTPVTRRRKKKKQSPARTSVVTRAAAKAFFSFPPKP